MGAASKASAGAQPPAQSVDAQLYTLLRKLELIAEDTEAEMQATTVSLVRAMPQAVADLDTLQDAAVDLRGAMDGLVEELRTLETQAGASLGLLVEAEHVKQRMLAVSQTLEQAQTLAQTLAAAELAISNGALLSAAEQVIP
ncbi:oligomeric Golgi complex subunit 7 [Pavlovales sp. CCMP2436]|nr:oligomeric Golgi complex subunit 7 [Pavlovales sp. CCMP2436]